MCEYRIRFIDCWIYCYENVYIFERDSGEIISLNLSEFKDLCLFIKQVRKYNLNEGFKLSQTIINTNQKRFEFTQYREAGQITIKCIDENDNLTTVSLWTEEILENCANLLNVSLNYQIRKNVSILKLVNRPN